jgi:hypothetical protein
MISRQQIYIFIEQLTNDDYKLNQVMCFGCVYI